MWLEIVDSKWKEFLVENELPPAEKERQRKRELFPSQEDFSRLAKGLMEDDDEQVGIVRRQRKVSAQVIRTRRERPNFNTSSVCLISVVAKQ